MLRYVQLCTHLRKLQKLRKVGNFVESVASNKCWGGLGPLHMSPVDRAGPVSEISAHPLIPLKKSRRVHMKRAGWLGCRDLGFSNRDLGKRAESRHMNRNQFHLGNRASPVNRDHVKKPLEGSDETTNFTKTAKMTKIAKNWKIRRVSD